MRDKNGGPANIVQGYVEQSINMGRVYLEAAEKLPSNPTEAELASLAGISAAITDSATKASTFLTSIGETATVSYNKNNASAIGTTADQTVAFMGSIVIAACGFTDTHDIFLGWCTKQNAWTVDDISFVPGDIFTPVTLATTLYAVWTDDVKTVTFVVNGGTGTMTAQHVPNHHTVALNSNTFVAPAGYSFLQWATAANGTGTTYANDGNIAIADANVTLYAIWDENTFTVTYNGNGATAGTMAVTSIQGDESANLRANAFTRTDYNFVGWATTSTGSRAYVDEASYTMGLANVTLYAVWTLASRTITFNTNTGTGGSTASQTIEVLSSANLTANGFTKTNYTFASWNTLANGTGTSYAGGASFTMVTGSVNLTLYAQWTHVSDVVTFNVATADSGTIAPQTMTLNTPTALTTAIPTLVKAGYVFGGWANSAPHAVSGTLLYANMAVVTLTDGPLTLYPIWNVEVTFNANGGVGSMAAMSVFPGTLTRITTSTITRANCEQRGWNTIANETGDAYTDGGNITPTVATTLYAIFDNSVAFDAGTGGSGTYASVTRRVGTSAALPSFVTCGFTRAAFHQTGWATEIGGGGTSYTDAQAYVMSSNDVTLYAQWTHN